MSREKLDGMAHVKKLLRRWYARVEHDEEKARIGAKLIEALRVQLVLARDAPRVTADDEINYTLEPLFNSSIMQAAFDGQLKDGAFEFGDTVRKRKGSRWCGRVVGFYSTKLTPIGYAVESDLEIGSVQIYPEDALEKVNDA